jgi:hypothetical protein
VDHTVDQATAAQESALQVEGVARAMLGEWRPRSRQQPFRARVRQRETSELFTVFFYGLKNFWPQNGVVLRSEHLGQPR